MESISSLLINNQLTKHVQTHVTKDALKKEETCTCTNTCTYDTIPKREYGLLLRKMESYGIVAPKAIVKRYGVFIVKRAVDYTEATPHVRNKAGYMTYMCQQFKKDLPQPKEEKMQAVEKPQSEEKEVLDTNIPNEHKVECRGSELPQIENWQDARKFLCDYMEGAYEKTDNVISFVNSLKKKYNFG